MKILKNKICTYLTSSNSRKKFAKIKVFSLQYVNPIFPRIHELIFEKFKRYIKKRLTWVQTLDYTDKIDQSILYNDINYAIKDKKFKVSIIVPNYNHETFLRKRLESIYSQTYQNFEVILLDDKSQDNSLLILEDYAQKYQANTRLISNKKNSGGVFHQWKRGIELAEGELIWIAESDDFCSSDFLEKLIVFFNNEAVMLAYAKSIFIKGDDEKEIWNINEYLADLNTGLWDNIFIASANKLVNKAWAIKNILPNASSALFRNPKKLKLLEDDGWKSMRICGDWIFYLHIIRGGLVAYTPETINYYRIHDKNTSASNYSQEIYYQEYRKVLSVIQSLYNIEASVIQKHQETLKQQWDFNMPHKTDDDFFRIYNFEDDLIKTRKPNIMMVTFALIAGGGETLPIKLANLLYSIGYSVTMVSFEQDDEELGIRNMLSKNIPLLKMKHIEKTGAIIQDMGIEIVHSQHAWVDLTLADLLAENNYVKMVVSTHGMYEMMSKEEFLDAFTLLNRKVKKIVYTAKKNLLPFEAVSNIDNLFIEIGNALEESPIHIISKSELGIDEKAFVVCLVSRAIPEKGWEEAIECIKLARNFSKKDIHLLLIGEGPEYIRLKSIGIEEYIHFLGFKANIRDYFAASDLGFLPTRFPGESFPLVIIDCLYAKKPVIASNIGEIKNMLMKDNYIVGNVFDLENMKIPINEVALMISRFATDGVYYNERSCYIEQVLTKYDVNVMLQKYDSMYTNLMLMD